jgi:diadenosine tetraphosphate (Ap4A) HIT family hydrolase
MNKQRLPSRQHSDDDCPLCDELTDDNCLSSFLDLYPYRESKFLAETNSLVLMPDISPIVPGHLLIVTKNHLSSFCQVAHCVWGELAFIKRLAYKISSKYAPPFFFEHGSCSREPSNSACIAHAHIHVIPAAVDIVPYLSRVSRHPLSIAPIDMKSAVPRQDSDYFYYEDSLNKGCVIVAPKKPFPRQFIRMVVAKEIGIPEWDWQMCLGIRLPEIPIVYA